MMNHRILPSPTFIVQPYGKARMALVAAMTLGLWLNPMFADIVKENNGVASLPLSSPSDSSLGITWHEVGDAGDLPGTAQVVTGGASLDAIIGTLDAGTDIDMYRIFITAPEDFSAITSYSGTNLSEDNDGQLFIFDEAGFLVAKDDDDGVRLLPAIYPGELQGRPAGVYYVTFDLFNIDPGDDPITYWSGKPVPPQTGPYKICLTAARAAPEPTTVLLIGLGGLALLRRW